MEQRLQRLNASQKMTVWSERIASCRNSGLSVRAWCRENELSEKTYYYWQHRLFKTVTEQQPSFVEITSAAVSGRSDIVATVRIGRMEADIYCGADAETVSTILRQMSHAE